MSEAIARKIIAERLKVAPEEIESKGISVISAGSFAMPGTRATPQAVEALREMNIDLSKHRSRPLSVELIHQADAIFTMSHAHAQAVTSLVPAAREKTHTLDPDNDIDDPIGADVGVYQKLAQSLEPLIARRLKEGVLP
jgi:protein-tyrosine-phosphatase